MFHCLLFSLGLSASVANAQEVSLWPDLTPLDNSAKMGVNDVAFIVSIGDYLYVTDIPNAQNSGQIWKTWLQEGRGVPEENIFSVH